MSHSINIPSFVTERKQDILDLGRFKRKASQNGGATRERIAMYRTRSYLRYSMSRAVRQRNKRGPFLIGKVNKDKNAMFRRHMRFPRELQCTFSNMAPPTESTVASRKNLQPTKKKQKRSDIKSPPLHLDLRSDPRPIVVLQKPGRLNTHVWHVKRFFVERQQSWYVPTKHKSRGLKAVDGLAEQCVVQDVSYLMAHQLCQGAEFHTIQVTGSASDVSSLFHQFCDPRVPIIGDYDTAGTQMTMAAIEKEVTFFARGKFPAGCIGPVTLVVVPFQLLPASEGVAPDAYDPVVKVLISCHPAIAHFIHQQLLSALPEVPTATEKNHADDAMSVESANSASDSQDGSPSSCCVHLAPAQWNRISLRGKSAAKSLLALLHPPNSSASDTTAISAVSQSQQQEETNNSAKIDYLSTLLGVRNVSNVWPDGKVIAVSIKDPRLVAWRTPASGFEGVGAGAADTKAKQRKVSAQLAHPPADLTSSPLFQENWAFQFKHEHDLNSEKHADKVTKWEGLFQTTTPFAVLSPPPSVATGVADIATATAGARAPNQRIVPPQVCPLWIVRKHSAARSHKTHKHCMVGFDIILPAAWGSLLFQTLQLRCGAAAVGSEEMDHLRAKAGVSSFPRDYPDTSAGRSFWQAYHNKMHAEDAKRPTAKQIAHNNLAGLLQAASHNSTDPVAAGIFLKSSPCMEFTGEKFESVLIVRGESYLKDFRPPPYEDLTSASIEQTRLEIASRAQADSTYFWTSPYIPKLPALPPLMFLQVLLVPVSKGLVLDLAEIVCPTEADIELFCAHKLNTQARRKGHGEVEESLQPGAAHSGFYKHAAAHSAAETARINKKQDVLDLSQSWLGVKLTEKVKFAAAPLPVSSSESEQNVDGDDAAAAGAKKKGAAKKKNQPKKVSADYDIGAQEGRKVIGTVTTGQKEHLNNTHFALGLCNVNALNNLFRRSYGRYLHPQVHILVLFRNSRSDWLRPATLQII